MNVNYRKTLIYFIALALALSVLITGCSLLGGKQRDVPQIEMMVDNPLPVKRTDEFIVLKIADLKEMAPDFSPNAFIVVDATTNQEIPAQLDDMDNDGEGDEIAMIIDMEPGERKNIAIRYAPEGRTVSLGYDKRTRAAMHVEYKGIGWESELIAYRIYPDHRNSISIFGKPELGLSLDKFAASVVEQGFNHLESWGINVLDSGDSTGCGGFGLWHDNKLAKPLNTTGRWTPKPDDRVARYTRIAADGPVRSIVQIIFDNWRVGDQTLKVTATYSIFAGQLWTRSEIKIEGADSPVKIAVGLMQSEAGILTKREEDGLFYTWGNQSHRDTPDNLGMAVMYPAESFDSFHENDKSGSHLAVLNPGADNEVAYWFMAAWNKGEIGVKKDKDFANLVSSAMERIRHPLTVTIMPSKPRQPEGTPQEPR